MQLKCQCGFKGYTEDVNTTCPKCHQDMRPRMIDFEEYRPIINDLFERMKASIIKHGDWSGYSVDDVFDKVAGEFDEYREAYVAEVLAGKHGQIDELGDVIVTALKGIRRLKCVQRANCDG